MLVISGLNDKITAHADARVLAKATGGDLLGLPDGSHFPQARKPVPVNLALRELVERANGGRNRGPTRDPTAHRPGQPRRGHSA